MSSSLEIGFSKKSKAVVLMAAGLQSVMLKLSFCRLNFLMFFS